MSPEHGEELERIEREYNEGHGDPQVYDHDHNRLGARMLLAHGPRKMPFPTGFAAEYADAMRANLRLSPNDAEHARALRGKQDFENWYGEVERLFTEIMTIIAGLTRYRDPNDDELVRDLEARGDELYGYYRDLKSQGDIPWLPECPGGIGSRDVLDTWERRYRSDEPKPHAWGEPQERLL